MATVESLRVIGEHVRPSEAVNAVGLTLGQHFDQLVEAGKQPRQKDGKLHIYSHVPAVLGVEDHTAEYDEAWEQYQVDGGVEGFNIRKDTETGGISFASIHGRMPARLSDEEAGGLFRADSWSTHMYFPSRHDPQETQRLVVDSWQTPMTHLTLAGNALSAARTAERAAAYDQLYAMICRRSDGAGIPLGAIAISHTVLGRGRTVPEAEAIRVNTVMEAFAEGVKDAIAWQHQIAAGLAAERQ